MCKYIVSFPFCSLFTDSLIRAKNFSIKRNDLKFSTLLLYILQPDSSILELSLHAFSVSILPAVIGSSNMIAILIIIVYLMSKVGGNVVSFERLDSKIWNVETLIAKHLGPRTPGRQKRCNLDANFFYSREGNKRGVSCDFHKIF